MQVALPPQTPAPPLPPLDPVIVAGGPPEWVAVVAVVSLIIAGIILFPIVRAFARRIEGQSVGGSVKAQLDQVHERLAEIERLEARVYELENRVEFSERLLSQQRDTLLQRGEGRGGP